MKNQALFSSKDKSKKIKCCLLQFMFAALRVKSSLFYFPRKPHLLNTCWLRSLSLIRHLLTSLLTLYPHVSHGVCSDFKAMMAVIPMSS